MFFSLAVRATADSLRPGCARRFAGASVAAREVLEATQRLLASIEAQDLDAYRGLCAPDLTCFEPEARGHRVEGLAFHEYYFGLEKGLYEGHQTLVDPRVQLLGKNGDAAVVTYVRLLQLGSETRSFEETRVWERRSEEAEAGKELWRHVHFHRSALQ